MNINKTASNLNISGFSGPSQNYYDAQERFSEILRTKLNVETPVQTETLTATNSNKSAAEMNLFNNSQSFSGLNFESGESLINLLAKEKLAGGNGASIYNNMMNKGLTIDNVVSSSNVKSKTSVTAEFIDSKLSGTPMQGLGEAFKKAESDYGVNALFLTGLAIHESNYGKSKIAQDKNNIFGFQAYDSSPYKSAAKYATKADSIDKAAAHLAKNYLSEGGKYFNGYSISAVGKRYATDPNWANGIEKRIKTLIGA